MQQQIEDIDEDKPIAGQITYFNILAQSIQRINEAIMNEKDARDAAENLLTDLPNEWTAEIQVTIDIITDNYNKLVVYNNQFLRAGYHTRESIREEARKQIYLAGKKYSREIKKVVVSLLKKKDLLYQTRNKIDRGFYLKEDDEE